MAQGLGILVLLLATFIVPASVFAQQIPQDKNTVGVAGIIATEQGYKMPMLNDNLSATGNYWFGDNIFNTFHNPAAFTISSDNESTGGPFGIGATNSPASNGLNQQRFSVVIPVAFLFTDDAGGLADSKVLLYGGLIRSALPTVSLVPTDQPLPPGGRITSAPVDFYATVGAIFNDVFNNEDDKKLNIATGLALINSSPLNGSWNGATSDNGRALAFNMSAVYNLRNQTGEGFVVGGGLENISPFKMRYNSSIAYNIPARVYAGGGYNTILPSGNKITVAGDIGAGMLTFAGRITGSVTTRYDVSLSDISDVHFNAGYAQGVFFKGPTVGTGIKLGIFNLNTGYCFGNSTLGIGRIQVGVSFAHL